MNSRVILSCVAAGAQLYAFPIDLQLPNGTLRFRTSHEEEEDYMTMPYSSYTDHSRFGRTIDHQRATGFTFLQELMDA